MPSSPGPDPRLDARVLELLTSRAGRLAFNGLRRTLGAHPETLARALRRLERDGLIERADGAYQLRDDLEIPSRGPAPPKRSDHPIASVELPPGVSAEDLFGRLAGRWFGRLRWVGVYERTGAPELVWSVAGGAGVARLAVRGRTLQVFVDRDPHVASGVELEGDGQDLLVHALGALRSGTPAEGGVAKFEIPAPLMAGSVEN